MPKDGIRKKASEEDVMGKTVVKYGNQSQAGWLPVMHSTEYLGRIKKEGSSWTIELWPYLYKCQAAAVEDLDAMYEHSYEWGTAMKMMGTDTNMVGNTHSFVWASLMLDRFKAELEENES